MKKTNRNRRKTKFDLRKRILKMLTDIYTILWKEMRELFTRQPNLRGGWTGMLIFLGVFGILMPLQSGIAWVTAPTTLLIWAWVPFIIVNSVVADSFAGERERHTLETLLASRLSDRAILFGKLATAIGYGWGITLAGVVLGWVTVNVVDWQGQLTLFPLRNGLGIVLVSFLVATLAAGVGVLVSLRASSVRQAQQTLSTMMFLVIIPLIALPLLPESIRIRISQFLVGVNVETVAIAGILILLVADLVLVGASMARFRRARLILD
jgi:ABC-2 type transport system permease protein